MKTISIRLTRTLTLLLFMIASTGVAAAAEAPASRRPNLIAIVTDEQGHWSIGAYGNRDARTPNMDRLAAEGAVFVNSFVNTPVCSPSRAGFFTGLHGTEVGVTGWINMNEASSGVRLPLETTTWPEVLKRSGYATALVGKWHLGHLPRHHPTNHGYDHFWGFLGGGTEPIDPHVEVDGKRTRLKGPVPDLLTDEAMRWIAANRAEPFAISMHFREPHLPYGPVPEQDSAPFEDADVAIPSWKVAEDTIILFPSDNGYNVGHHGHPRPSAAAADGVAGVDRRPDLEARQAPPDRAGAAGGAVIGQAWTWTMSPSGSGK